MSKKFTFDRNNTFCISLEGANVRWESMERRFSEFNLDVTRWTASTAPTDNFVSNLSITQKACGQSHINIYKHMLENNLEYAFILEDDACFDKNWEQKLEEFNYENWDLIILNGSEDIKNKNIWECTIDNLQYLTAGYIISKRGAKWILDTYDNRYCASDWMTSRLQTLGNSYCYFPWLIIQEGKDTRIESDVCANREKVIRLLNSIDYAIDNYSI
jgi:glycosyl transferase family 25